MSSKLFQYTEVKTKNSKTFVVFHGTGGDEHDLIPLAQAIDPSCSVLSLRGNTQENGMNRFFERYDDGTFHLESLESEVKKLHLFLGTWIKKNNKKYEDLVFLGYSNGANFAFSFLVHYPDLIKRALLFHPSLPYDPSPVSSLKGTKVFLTHGKVDQSAPIEEIEKMVEVLKKADADVSFFEHGGGHDLRKEEIEKAKEFIAA